MAVGVASNTVSLKISQGQMTVVVSYPDRYSGAALARIKWRPAGGSGYQTMKVVLVHRWSLYTGSLSRCILYPYHLCRVRFQPLPQTTMTTDCGWGCMIRSGQMILANAINIHLLSKGM